MDKNIDVNNLKITSKRLRKDILDMTRAAGSGHPGPSFSIVEIMTYLYFAKMHIKPDQPKWSDRDRLVLSKGHAAPALYAALCEKGFFDRKTMLSLRKIGSPIQGHPCAKMDGIDATTGSLGIGLSQAVGMALGMKMKKVNVNIYAIIGDGECDEGQIWEAALSASHNQLDNLFVFLDNNHEQYEGEICKVLNLEPLEDKWKSFGWHTKKINGHDFNEIDQFTRDCATKKNMPHIAIAQTIRGYGVSFMQGDPAYHSRALDNEEYEKAVKELQ